MVRIEKNRERGASVPRRLRFIAMPLVFFCGLVAGEVAAAGECPLIIGVATTPGRPDVFKSYIGGQWRTSSSGKTLKVLSPVNETALFEVQVALFHPIPCSVRALLHWQPRGRKTCSYANSALRTQACTQGEIDEAFAEAKKAQALWSKTPLYD